MEASKVLLHPVGTEKAIRLLDQNKIVFVVNRRATKEEIKRAFEDMFKVKVDKVNTVIVGNAKKAYIKLASGYSAVEIATNLGLL